MGMSAKIIRTLGGVGVPSIWLDPTVTGTCRGGGGSLFKRQPFFGHKVTWRTHIWYVTSAGAGRTNFDVDANPKISISIPAAGLKSRCGTRKTNDFEVNCTIFRKIFSAPAAGRGEGVNLLNCELS